MYIIPFCTYHRRGSSLLRTAVWLAEQLTDAKFEVEKQASGNVIIRCQGIGYTAPTVASGPESVPSLNT